MTSLPFIDLKTQLAAIRPSIEARMARVLDHGQYILGPEVEELEAALASKTGAAHCITVASGTEALLIGLMALGVGPGDEVITSAFSFAAAAEMIALLGATPRFVDVERDTANIDAGQVEARINARTKAIIPVALYGQPADMARLSDIAERHGLALFDDAAQSFGSTYQGKPTGALAPMTATSFFPSKPLGCFGDGGALFVEDDSLARTCREIRTHGQERRYHHTRVGVGGRMDTIQCAVVLAKLERFEWEIEQRLAKGALYNQLFDEAGIQRIHQRADRTSVFAQYTIMVDKRDEVAAALQAQRIPTAVHYPAPINVQPAYAALDSECATPGADVLARRVLSLPMSADIPDDDIVRVADAVVGCVRP